VLHFPKAGGTHAETGCRCHDLIEMRTMLEAVVRIVLATIIAIGLGAAMAPRAASAQAVSTRDATPDLSGLWNRVGHLWLDPILDDDGGKPVDRLKVDRPGADDIWAGDFNNPILQPWAREIVKRNAESEIRREHVYTADDSCWPSGVPQVVNLLEEIQFLQARDRVIIIYQRDHQVRWIWLDRAHSADPAPSWYGESVGHYEGDTLVVDTVGLKEHKMSVVDPFGTPHTDRLHVVERYQLFSTPFGKGLEITVEVEDPGAFTAPWKGTAEYRQNREVTQLREVVCAENNRDFADGSNFGTIPQEATPPF
jgi:hypothetical protein